MSMQTMGAMWLYDNNWGVRNADKRQNKSFTYRFLVVWNYFLIIGGSFITVRPVSSCTSCTHADSVTFHRCSEPYVSLGRWLGRSPRAWLT